MVSGSDKAVITEGYLVKMGRDCLGFKAEGFFVCV